MGLQGKKAGIDHPGKSEVNILAVLSLVRSLEASVRSHRFGLDNNSHNLHLSSRDYTLLDFLVLLPSAKSNV